jgi:hypothetical protein
MLLRQVEYIIITVTIFPGLHKLLASIYFGNEDASSSDNHVGSYVIKILLSTYFWCSYASQKFKYTYTGPFFCKVGYIKYDVPLFLE